MRVKLLLFTICFLFVWGVFARNDCDTVEAEVNIQDKAPMLSLVWMFPNKAIYQARINLKAYCCDEWLLTGTTCEDDKSEFQKVYPQSHYLYDHLVDVAFKRLDAAGIIYDLWDMGVLDQQAVDRRKYIMENVAEKKDGNFALGIEKEYKKYRKDNKNYVASFGDFEKLIWYKLTDVQLIDKKYTMEESRPSLTQKYHEVCGLAASVYYLLVNDGAKTKGKIWEWFRKCTLVPYKRIYDETNYVKTIVVQKSNQLLEKSVKKYFSFFGQTRLMNLQWNILRIADLFQTIAKWAQPVKQCN